MPFALVTIGLIMVVSGARGTFKDLGNELASDFAWPGFSAWIVAIGGVGALGYIPQLKSFSRAFMALILIVIVVRNGGVFDNFIAALKAGPKTANIAKDVSEKVTVTARKPYEGTNGTGQFIVPGDAAGNFGKLLNIFKTFAATGLGA